MGLTPRRNKAGIFPALNSRGRDADKGGSAARATEHLDDVLGWGHVRNIRTYRAVCNGSFAQTARAFLSHNKHMVDHADNGAAAAALKALRERSGLGVREVARLLDLPSSTYATYERSYKKELLPVEMAKKLAPIFA